MEIQNDITAYTGPGFWASLVACTVIVTIHLVTPRLRFIRNPKGAWLPISVGVAIAYVFVDLFPHLAKTHYKLSEAKLTGVPGLLSNNLYVISLAGFTAFLGVALWVKRFNREQCTTDLTLSTAPLRVKLECASLTAYNFLIGYILAEQASIRPEPILLFGVAMAIHFAGIDGLFREHFPKLADRAGRYLFAAGLMAGWASGIVFTISPAWLIACYAFLAGGIIVVATIYELPEIQSPRQYWQFFAGATLFAALILATDYFK